jgi:hypothetical protein
MLRRRCILVVHNIDSKTRRRTFPRMVLPGSPTSDSLSAVVLCLSLSDANPTEGESAAPCAALLLMLLFRAGVGAAEKEGAFTGVGAGAVVSSKGAQVVSRVAGS